jgi:hypothetical protein
VIKENAHPWREWEGQWPGVARREFENSVDLLAGHMELIDDFLDARTRFEVFENRSHGHPGVAKNPGSATPVRHAFHRETLRPIESCHVSTSLPS